MDNDDEQILELEFADDNLESMGYERPVAGPLVLYDREQQRSDERTSLGALFRLEKPQRATHPTPDLGHLNLAPRYEANSERESEPKALLNTGNVNININVNAEDAHLRRRAAPPIPIGARAGGAEGDGNGGNGGNGDAEYGLPRHARPKRAGFLLSIACISLVAALCVFLLLREGGRDHQHGHVQLSSAPGEQALHVAPGAFSKAHDNLKQDLAQLEELFYRARSALPPASSLRRILEDGPQPQALREEVEALGSLHNRLVGSVMESDIARGLRVSKGRLRAATAELDDEPRRLGSDLSLGAVRAEWTHAKDMSGSVITIIADIEAARSRAARICGRRPFVDAHGSWTLSEGSTCSREDNQWQLKGGFAMSLGNGVSDAQAAFGLINWICGDLDALTSTESTVQVTGSIAVEARRGQESWEQLLQGWSDLEAATAAN